MALSSTTTDLLAKLAAAMPELGLRVVGVGSDHGNAVGVQTAELSDARIEVRVPGGQAATAEWITSLLSAIVERERLADDMESMNASVAGLLEQVAMLGETLPRLSAGSDEEDIATLGVRACQLAAAVDRVLYVAYAPERGGCEVLVDLLADGLGAAADDVSATADGLLGEVLAATEGVVLRTVPTGGRLGEPGSVEHLARHQFLGAPVTYGSGDKRVVLGALILLDKAATGYAAEKELGSEEGQVAESFAAMLGSVLGARKTAELGKELSMARMIQRQILPRSAPAIGGFDLAAEYEACGAVGGDYFDYVPTADGRTTVVVADVSGHNLASGMMMVGARATLRSLSSVRDTLADVFDDFAAAMFEDLTRTERFLTAAAFAIAPNSPHVEYVSAGHNDLLVFRAATGAIEAVATESTILGFMPRPGYTSRWLELQPGDCMLLFTDGITEAMDAAGEMFGDDRLAAAFSRAAASNCGARAIVDAIVGAVAAFRGSEEVTDDVTAVVVRYTGEGNPR